MFIGLIIKKHVVSAEITYFIFRQSNRCGKFKTMTATSHESIRNEMNALVDFC